MKFLVTGAGGQLGKAIESISNKIRYEFILLKKQDIDITNKNQINIIKKYNPDFIINTAAYTDVDSAEKNYKEAISVNRDGPKNLAIIANELDIPLIHISTDYVFDGLKPEPYNEDDITNPINKYGTSKLLGENEILTIHNKVIIIRTSWLFSIHGKNFVNTMLSVAKKNNEINVINDQYGSPTSCNGLAKACIKICETISKNNSININWGIYHFSGYPFVNWHEYATSIFEIQNLDLNITKIKPISSDDYKSKTKRPKNSTLSNNKIKEEFGINPDDWRNELNMILSKYEH